MSHYSESVINPDIEQCQESDQRLQDWLLDGGEGYSWAGERGGRGWAQRKRLSRGA